MVYIYYVIQLLNYPSPQLRSELLINCRITKFILMYRLNRLIVCQIANMTNTNYYYIPDANIEGHLMPTGTAYPFQVQILYRFWLWWAKYRAHAHDDAKNRVDYSDAWGSLQLLFHVDLTVAQTSAHISDRVTRFKKITRFLNSKHACPQCLTIIM
jgi:hypothetical protein